MNMQELYNLMYGDNAKRCRPTDFIARIEGCPGFADQPLPELATERDRYLRLLSDYGYMLYAVGRYESAVAVLTRVLRLHEDTADRPEVVWQSASYEQALFVRSCALSALGRKEAARQDALSLVAHYPGELQYSHLLHGLELYFRNAAYRKVNLYALLALFAGLLITLTRPVDPSVRFLGHVLAQGSMAVGLGNYVLWKRWYTRWKRKRVK